MQKLRILCLHGYHGSADVLRGQMTTLTDGMDPLAEFVQVNAPSLASGDFGWWHAVRDEKSTNNEDPGVGPGAARYEGWALTCRWVVSVFKREGPFDGVFGFSQGAALAVQRVACERAGAHGRVDITEDRAGERRRSLCAV
jgi:predicted esterase